MFQRTAFAASLVLLYCALSAESQTVLTADRVLELAERQNPEVLIAGARAAQAEGTLLTARFRLPGNQEVDVKYARPRRFEPTSRRSPRCR